MDYGLFYRCTYTYCMKKVSVCMSLSPLSYIVVFWFGFLCFCLHNFFLSWLSYSYTISFLRISGALFLSIVIVFSYPTDQTSNKNSVKTIALVFLWPIFFFLPCTFEHLCFMPSLAYTFMYTFLYSGLWFLIMNIIIIYHVKGMYWSVHFISSCENVCFSNIVSYYRNVLLGLI